MKISESLAEFLIYVYFVILLVWVCMENRHSYIKNKEKTSVIYLIKVEYNAKP